MIYIMNHYSRDCSGTVAAVEKDAGVAPVVFTDMSDFRKERSTRWKGVVLNHWRILSHPDTSTWRVILHDDLIVPPGLFRKMQHILAFAPATVVSFYNPTNGGYLGATEQGHHVLRTYSNWWTQCHAMHRDMVSKFLRWTAEKRPLFGDFADFAEDTVLWRFCSHTKTPIFAVVPSLVQHEGFDKSTHKIPARVGKYRRDSATFDPAFDVTKVDWRNEFANPFKDDSKKLDRRFN